MVEDSEQFRGMLARLLPGLVINGVAKRSGQRVVYFARFDVNALSFPPEHDPEDVELIRQTTAERQEWGDVVVKVSTGMSAEVISYLQREIRILNSLNVPCYPKLHLNDVFALDPQTEEPLPARLFLTIEERIIGQPLSSCAQAYSEEAAVVKLLVALVQALKYLWEQRPPIVHRDLKPDNILIRPDGQVVVIDLGISREEGSAGVTQTAALWGPCTPQYSSPEQAQNEKRNISFKSDFFALGTVAYELITGNNPFNPNGNLSAFDVLDNVANANVPPLKSVANVSQPFSDLVEMMMQKHPYKRPRTPDALLENLESLLGAS